MPSSLYTPLTVHKRKGINVECYCTEKRKGIELKKRLQYATIDTRGLGLETRSRELN